MWEAILLKTIIPLVITAIFGWIGSELRKRNQLTEQNQIRNDGREALEAAVAKVQVEFVDLAKAAAADGKLSKAECDQAKDKAIDTALEIASGKASEYLLGLGWNLLGGIVETIVGKNKKANVTLHTEN